jgi:hypothetical protein
VSQNKPQRHHTVKLSNNVFGGEQWIQTLNRKILNEGKTAILSNLPQLIASKENMVRQC